MLKFVYSSRGDKDDVMGGTTASKQDYNGKHFYHGTRYAGTTYECKIKTKVLICREWGRAYLIVKEVYLSRNVILP